LSGSRGSEKFSQTSKSDGLICISFRLKE